MRCYVKRAVSYGVLVLCILVIFNILINMQHPVHTNKTKGPETATHRLLYTARPVHNKDLHNNQTQQSRGNKPTTVHMIRTTNYNAAKLWPSNRAEQDDRILAQMSYVPPFTQKHKLILGFNVPNLPKNDVFHQLNCPVHTCILTEDTKSGPFADAVILEPWVTWKVFKPSWQKPLKQVWVLYTIESPANTPDLTELNGLVNWTATYRRDSTLSTPYERFVPYSAEKLRNSNVSNKNYASGKTKKVAWIVSNCNAQNGRMEYVKELQKYIDVDIYGTCGTLTCPHYVTPNPCLKNYKFYLAFENSNCEDYITEKFYVNALWNGLLPIGMGARPEDYALSAPPHSYIHVNDFASPRELAEYLHKLDKDDSLYNAYFRWIGTGEFINTKFWCRLCAMLHDDTRNVWYKDINAWWRGGNTCVNPLSTEKWATWKTVRNLKPEGPEPLQYREWNESSNLIPRHKAAASAAASENIHTLPMTHVIHN